MNQEILTLATQAIKSQFEQVSVISKEELTSKIPQFSKPTATFVTLTINGNLRGCIGSLVAHRDLYDDIINNAKNAAFGDPRFVPLSKNEFEQVDIEISILSEPKSMPYETIEELKQKIQMGKHGVILKKGGNQATFLPQVWDQLPSFELFFEHLCNKAGLYTDCLANHPQIYTYEVQKVK